MELVFACSPYAVLLVCVAWLLIPAARENARKVNKFKQARGVKFDRWGAA